VVSMERSTTDVVGGALLAENAGAALDEIEQVSNQIASLVQNISSSARQQAGAAADVTKRTTRLREIGSQTGKATSATAASISKLSELATQLRKTVEGFTLPGNLMQTGTLSRPALDVQRPTPAANQAKAG
jgi:twitching motility protein PilJ